jgi:hypothetical protein
MTDDGSVFTFGGKKYETSSKLNKVPAPNATATPAAQAALRISRRLAKVKYISSEVTCDRDSRNTFIVFIFRCDTADNVANAGLLYEPKVPTQQKETIPRLL